MASVEAGATVASVEDEGDGGVDQAEGDGSVGQADVATVASVEVGATVASIKAVGRRWRRSNGLRERLWRRSSSGVATVASIRAEGRLRGDGVASIRAV